MLSLDLHLRIIGWPGRIGGLERFLAHAAGTGTSFAQCDAIAAHWLREAGEMERPNGV